MCIESQYKNRLSGSRCRAASKAKRHMPAKVNTALDGNCVELGGKANVAGTDGNTVLVCRQMQMAKNSCCLVIKKEGGIVRIKNQFFLKKEGKKQCLFVLGETRKKLSNNGAYVQSDHNLIYQNGISR